MCDAANKDMAGRIAVILLALVFSILSEVCNAGFIWKNGRVVEVKPAYMQALKRPNVNQFEDKRWKPVVIDPIGPFSDYYSNLQSVPNFRPVFTDLGVYADQILNEKQRISPGYYKPKYSSFGKKPGRKPVEMDVDDFPAFNSKPQGSAQAWGASLDRGRKFYEIPSKHGGGKRRTNGRRTKVKKVKKLTRQNDMGGKPRYRSESRGSKQRRKGDKKKIQGKSYKPKTSNSKRKNKDFKKKLNAQRAYRARKQGSKLTNDTSNRTRSWSNRLRKLLGNLRKHGLSNTTLLNTTSGGNATFEGMSKNLGNFTRPSTVTPNNHLLSKMSNITGIFELPSIFTHTIGLTNPVNNMTIITGDKFSTISMSSVLKKV